MNSRKRLNDGHYESTTRSLQNSKYSNNRYFNNYYRERDPSPKRVAHRSVSPEGSPRERFHPGSSYRNRERDREYNKKDKYSDKRPRDRDLEYKNYGKKSKVRDRSSSEDEHKDNDRFYEKPRYGERDSIRRGPEKERRFGDWKEMISKGSGKKYYYNERDKSSQWEKPDEWAEFDMSREYPTTNRYRDKDRDRKSERGDRYSSGGSRRHYDKHSISRPRWQNESYPSTSSSHYKRDVENPDMDISPESTPTSEPSYASPTASSHANNLNCNSNHDEVVASPNGHHSKSYLQNHHHSLASGNSSSNNRLHNSKSSSAAVSSPSTHQHYSSHRNRSLTPETNNDANSHHNTLSLRNSPSNNSISLIPNHSVSRSDSSNQLISDGPPTPEMDLNSTNEHRRLDSTSGLNSLQNVMSSVMTQTQNRLNILTPSLAKFFRPDLITHVTNWPAEALEKQAQKIAEDVYLHGDLECCRISAEIQCARSIVRVTEIAATIQTQRKLFLKDQIQEYQENSNSASAITF